MKRKKWREATIEKYNCKFTVEDKATWDCYGSEHEKFYQDLGNIQASQQKSMCSNDVCPKRL